MPPTETARALMNERNTMLCECCNERPAEEAHHCLYGKDNRNCQAKKLLNMSYNLQLVCKKCHACDALSHENRVRFWGTQCERYGHDVMLAWHESLPYKPESKEFAYR